MIQGFKFHSNNQETVELYDYNSLQNLPESDKTLSVDGGFADGRTVGDEITNLKSALINYNVFNLVDEYGLHNNSQFNGITWAWNEDTCSASGTATDGSFLSLINHNTAMPSYLVPGRSYWIIYNATDSGIKIEVIIYKNGSYFSTERFGETVEYTIPADASGIIIRLYVAKNTTVNGTIRPIVLNEPTTAILDGENKYLAPKIANFGDSLTWGRDGSGSASTQTAYTITKYFTKKGFKATNFGVGGMGYFATSGNQNALAKLQATDLTGYELITLGFGTNDNTAVLGTIDDTDGTTMIGAMYQCWQYIRTQNSTCTVVFIAPPNASTFGAKETGYWYGYKRGPLYDYTLSDLVEGMRAFCSKYNIPFIDNLNNGIDVENIATLLPDGVHPNDNGYKIYSRYIAETITSGAYSSADTTKDVEDSFVSKSEYGTNQRTEVYNSKTGNPILLNDAALDKNISVTVDDGTSLRWNGKNLFKINPEQASFTKNGVTFTFNKDEGRISVASSGATGTAVSTQSTDTLNGKANMNINFKFAFPTDTVITISSNASQFREYNAKWYLQITDGTTGYFEDGNGLTMTALAGVEYGIRVIVQSGFSTSERLDIFPQLEINDHKTEFEPYVGGIINDLTEDGEENIFEISHNITATSNNISWSLNKSKGSVSISSNGASNDTVVYDTSLDLSHGSYNLWHFTPTEDTAVFLTGVGRAGLRLQISDGSIIWTDYGKGVGLVAKANTEYFVRLLVNSGFVGTAVICPKVATGLSELHGLETTVLYAAEGEITATYEQRPMYDCAYVSKDTTKSIMEITGDKILAPFKSFKPIVTFIDDDTSTLTDVNNYASVFTALGKVGTYAVMTRNLENSSELKQRLLDLETAGFGMVFHCEYQEGAETNYFLNDSNRNMELVRENITLGLRQMETYGFQNYRHWVTPYGVNDKDIVDVAKDYGLESLISMSNNSWVANTGNVSRYNIPRYSVSTSTPSDFPAIKIAANECKKTNGWLLIVTHANTWRHNNVVPEMQALLTSVINYLTGIGFEVVPFARAYESRKGMFYFNELF